MLKLKVVAFFVISLIALKNVQGQTTALWTFDEQQGIYPSDVLNDVSDNNYPLVLGRGGMIVAGKFGNALEPLEQPAIKLPKKAPEGAVKFGIFPLPKKPGDKVAPMSWANDNFCALMTSDQKHLRNLVGFANATDTKLNLGDFDWTVEFWFSPEKNTKESGTVFEIGSGPRGENNKITSLSLDADFKGFTLYNEPSGTKLFIPSNNKDLSPGGGWHHLAFVYSAKDGQLKHYVDGILQKLPDKASLKSLEHGDAAYMSLGRDGLWKHPLQGKIDELRISEGEVYTSNFTPPSSMSPLFNPKYTEGPLKKGPPLLFAYHKKVKIPVDLGSRKYLFFDNSLFAKSDGIKFTVNPPDQVKKVFDVEGSYRKHLTVIQDEKGLIRIYNAVNDDHLEVMTSKDGIHFESPEFLQYKNHHNIVINEPVGTGEVFIDPNAPEDQKWKYVSGYHDRGVYVYYISRTGTISKREMTSALPFRTGSQTNIFYDDQSQIYTAFFRTDMGTTPAGVSERHHVMVQTKDIMKPWPFKPVSQAGQAEIAKHIRLHKLNPWYMDNGPLTPGGFGVEYPRIFGTIDSLDPVGTDMYIPKAVKYQWAPDAYFAFPEMYFHYDGDGPEDTADTR